MRDRVQRSSKVKAKDDLNSSFPKRKIKSTLILNKQNQYSIQRNVAKPKLVISLLGDKSIHLSKVTTLDDVKQYFNQA